MEKDKTYKSKAAGTAAAQPKAVEARPSAPVRRLYRLPKSGKIAGVCAGLADYLDIDVTLIRIIFVVLAIASGGFGLILYLIMAIVVPADESRVLLQENHDTNIGQNINSLSSEISSNGGVSKLRNWLGIGLVLFGGWLLLLQFFPQWLSMNWELVWPALLIVFGLFLVTRSRR